MSKITTFIPEEIIEKCAAAAYEATQRHYGGAPYAWVLADARTKNRVKKDVKAVLLGGRTAANLHTEWARRKMTALTYGRIRREFPSALKTFEYLPKEDKEGYELFVITVRNTYYHESHNKLKAQEAVVKTSHLSLAYLANKASGTQLKQIGWAHGEVVVRFDSFTDAAAFYNRIGSNG
jgi:hypothetical protein